MTDFNANWQFKKEGGEFKTVTLPHDAMLEETRSADAKSGSAQAYFPSGRYIYEKHFSLTDEQANKHITFVFGGVYKNAKVFINGTLAKGAAPYGYIPFAICADGLVNAGDNIIRVETDNSAQPDSRWYSGAGIYRSVNMYMQEQERILLDGVKIKTISIDPPKVSISVRHEGGEVHIDILDGEKITAQAEGDSAELTLPEAELWSAENPKLYTARITLTSGGNVIEQREERFGIRTVSWDRNGLYINGKSTLLKGGCIHSDNGIIGAREFYESAYRRIRILKEGGFNAVRCAHDPASTELLKACDELGMYVMDEAWDMWYKKKNPYDYANEFEANYKNDLAAMVAHDYNHPSVIMFSIGNEVSEPAEEKGLALAKEMTGLLHTLDDSRAVCGGFNLMIITKAAKGKGVYKEDGGRDESGDKMSGMNSAMFNMIAGMVGTGMNKASNGSKADKIISPLLDTVDIAGYNYASGRYAEDARLHPERVIMGSETFPQDLAKNWETVKKQPSLIGDFMWTAWDYLGETGIGTWSYEKDAKGFDKSYPWLLADTGAYDILGDPTGEALWTKAVWGKESDVFLAVRPCNGKGRRLIKSTWRGTNAIPSWSWSGCEGEQAVVEVFSRANVVGLYLNGELIGRKRTKNCRAVFKLRYKPGKLTAVAYDSKKRIAGKTSLITAGEAGINVSPEKTTAAVGEIIYVDISIADSKGIVESNKDTKLSVTVENGELIGFGSAAPRTEERFDLGEYTTWHGRAQAVVRASSSGVLTVLAAGQGYKAAKAEITVE
ncbi:MAG: DUF4982 domain-containing protein [Ruminococcus sp.]|nr:DUF4982 domain-containing protein [Ruminococcus sp.]